MLRFEVNLSSIPNQDELVLEQEGVKLLGGNGGVFEQWFRAKLKERGLTISKFCTLTGYKISGTQIYAWFKGTYQPRPSTLSDLCEWLSKFPAKGPNGKLRWEKVDPTEAAGALKARSSAAKSHKVKQLPSQLRRTSCGYTRSPPRPKTKQ